MYESYDNGRRSESICMNNKEVVKKIKEVFEQTYYFVDVLSADCTIDSLVRIDRKVYGCDKCILADTINTVRREGALNIRDVMCPMIMEEEVKVLR